ncbi:MAG: hypothetical protein JXO49_04675 [Deltaproteobacteria bacterium]|nr:hypothetical protein [Candidatus Anaeroferrophillus wilburensis]MBN2888623.1 hypothetical protein [Deltaproteobacteria bacterium]
MMPNIEKLRMMLDHFPDKVSVQDSQRRVIFTNWTKPECFQNGASADHPYCYNIYMNATTPCKNCIWDKLMATGEPQWGYKKYLNDGKIREVYSYPLDTGTGKVDYVVQHIRELDAPFMAGDVRNALQCELKETLEKIFAAIFV